MFSYSEIKEAAIIFLLRDILEQKTKLELIKLLENNTYSKILNSLLYPFEYLGNVDEELKQLNQIARYLHLPNFFQSKKDYDDFVEDLINNFCSIFSVDGFRDNNSVYYYLRQK